MCGIDLPGATDPSAVTLPENMEESRAILEEWENDLEATLTYLESHGDYVFDSVVLSASMDWACVQEDSAGLQVWSLRFAWPDRELCVCI